MNFGFDQDLLKEVLKKIYFLWNFPIITVDQNPITIGTLTVGISLFFVGLFLARKLSRRFVRKGLSRWIDEESSLYSLETFTFYLFVVFFSLFALKIANIPLTIFTVVGGALAIGVGFGSQNLVNNFISGVILMIERPIKVGDTIELDGISGEVQDIGMRCTRILVTSNRHMIVPNSSFLEKNFINWTHQDRLVRGSVKVGVAYGSPVRRVEEIFIECVNKLSSSVSHENSSVFFKDFGDNALNFEVFFWVQIEDLASKIKVESDLRFLIYEALNKENIAIAFPQRDIHLHTEKPIKVNIDSKT